MARSSWKGPYIQNQKVNDFKNLALRNFKIMPNSVGKNYLIYNGKALIKIKVLEEMIGHKFGEICFTRKEFSFSKNNGTKN